MWLQMQSMAEWSRMSLFWLCAAREINERLPLFEGAACHYIPCSHKGTLNECEVPAAQYGNEIPVIDR
jgi:hypothetical protein